MPPTSHCNPQSSIRALMYNPPSTWRTSFAWERQHSKDGNDMKPCFATLWETPKVPSLQYPSSLIKSDLLISCDLCVDTCNASRSCRFSSNCCSIAWSCGLQICTEISLFQSQTLQRCWSFQLSRVSKISMGPIAPLFTRHIKSQHPNQVHVTSAKCEDSFRAYLSILASDPRKDDHRSAMAHMDPMLQPSSSVQRSISALRWSWSCFNSWGEDFRSWWWIDSLAGKK